MMNMNHEGGINVLFVPCPWQHLQLFVSVLVLSDSHSTVWQPLNTSQAPLGGNHAIS
ncbi:rCG27668 [Rattus norvegicus]|uniref:RCG27668 n=1 Tax=Rattus norvegicus TaxID=10116 RepID=A6KBE4_RAT|nr:rCG27668 [Rattus norvegicus]